ncbi:MAG TPA: methyl-accepting chemotaxis protein [Negativicutes bacterium]|nr:methyl-accepting chemotaxis protein [Negativicutes bacterium]
MGKLEALIDVIETIRDLNVLDCNVMICDAEAKILCYVDGKTFSTSTKVGATAPGGLVKGCIENRKITRGIIPSHLYGVTLKAICHPVIEADGTLSGVIGTATSLKMQEQLHSAAQSVAATSQEMTATTEELAMAASRLANSLSKAKVSGELVISEIDKTDNILKFVSDVASNSNLLGLNAAIEAARAGEQGRGFAVVADEIRKMADNSAKSVSDIKDILRNIQGEIRKVVDIVATTAEQGETQVVTTDNIRATMQDLAVSAAEIEKIAEIV